MLKIVNINRNCSYLMDICFEKYFELSKDGYSKIKKFRDNNIDTFESILAPIHNLIDLYKKLIIIIVITHIIIIV